MKWVFISHSYKSNPERNKRKVDEVCKEIISTHDNVLPISPLHMFSFYEDDKGVRDDIMDIVFLLITYCDELWQYGESEGCIEEVKYAEGCGVLVKDKRG